MQMALSMDEDLAFASATRLAGMIRNAEISSGELLDFYLARIEKLNPRLNAVVTLDAEGARRDARLADEQRAAGKLRGPLHGLPMTIKDSFETAGLRTTCGLASLHDHVPQKDAVAVDRLRRAGAIIFGKTNVPAGAGDHQTHNTIFGRTLNPHDPDLTPGGSSGGAATAVAAGFTAAEIGSDVGGSIRVPAHFCGVYGHNTTYGIVPLAGHIPPPPGSLVELPMATIGPIARSAFDLELLLEVMSTPAPTESFARPLRSRAARHERIDDFRVAVWADDDAYPIEPSYRRAINEFAETLRRLGAEVTTVAPPIAPEESREIYALTLFGMWAASLPEDLYETYASAARSTLPDDRSWHALMGRGSAQSLRDWSRLTERREQCRQKWAAFFDDYDVLICPVTSALAFKHMPVGTDHSGQLRASVDIGGRPIGYLDLLLWPGVITLPKLPSTVVPLPQMVEGRPAGVQLVAAHLNDATSLRLAQLIEEAVGGFVRPR